MSEVGFEDPTILRMAATHAARMVHLNSLPWDYRFDLTHEVLLALWRTRAAYDPNRASWRTFAEAVVKNRLVSLMRAMHSRRAGGRLRGKPIEDAVGLAAPAQRLELRIDVWRALGRVGPFDREVARKLMEYSALETSHQLGVSRSTIYRSIGRLRASFLGITLR